MNPKIPKSILGCLFDVDGVLFEPDGPVPGAVEALQKIYKDGYPLAYLSNTTRKPANQIFARLQEAGFPGKEKDIITPCTVAAHYLRKEKASAYYFLPEATKADFSGIPENDKNPDFLVIGDMGDAFVPAVLDRAFNFLLNGAGLLALQKNKFWKTAEGFKVDAGGYVALLEYAADKKARVVGKPEKAFFKAGLARLGLKSSEALMVGDDVQQDVNGAMDAGLFGVLVRTGKYRNVDLERAKEKPDLVLSSVAELG